MSEEYLLPVTVKDVNGQLVADCNSGCFIHAFAVDKKVLKSADDLRVEGAEQMRRAWLRIITMTQDQRYRLFSFNDAGCLLINESAESILKKLKEYDSVAREGQIWESKESEEEKIRLAIINPRFDGEIHYLAFAYERGYFFVNHEPPSDFYDEYQNTGRTIDLEKDNVFEALKGEGNE